MARTRRRSDHDLGRRGEAAAAGFLKKLGYRVVARNLRTRHGEVDLLVRRRRLWVAVEVKTRAADEAPEQAVSTAQLERIGRALRALAPRLWPRPRELRVDVVAVRWPQETQPEIRHFEGPAFTPMAQHGGLV